MLINIICSRGIGQNDKWECIYDKSILKKFKKNDKQNKKNDKQNKKNDKQNVIKVNTNDDLLNGVCLIDFDN